MHEFVYGFVVIEVHLDLTNIYEHTKKFKLKCVGGFFFLLLDLIFVRWALCISTQNLFLSYSCLDRGEWKREEFHRIIYDPFIRSMPSFVLNYRCFAAARIIKIEWRFLSDIIKKNQNVEKNDRKKNQNTHGHTASSSCTTISILVQYQIHTLDQCINYIEQFDKLYFDAVYCTQIYWHLKHPYAATFNECTIHKTWKHMFRVVFFFVDYCVVSSIFLEKKQQHRNREDRKKSKVGKKKLEQI